MLESVVDDLLLMPSARRFKESLLADVRSRRCSIVEFPDQTVCDRFAPVFTNALDRAAFCWARVRSLWCSESDSLVGFLAEQLGVGTTARRVGDWTVALMNSAQLPDVIWVTDLGPTARRTDEWRTLLRDWARLSDGPAVEGGERPALCLFALGGELPTRDLPTTPVFSLRRWWGIPSQAEMKVLCRFAQPRKPQDAVQSTWRESLLPHLVGTDPGLVEVLWEPLCKESALLVDSLCAYGEQKGWGPEVLSSSLELEGMLKDLATSESADTLLEERATELWQKGAVWRSAERGIELHTAILAALRLHNDLRHRMWRGQVELLLPLVDSVRLAACEELSRRHGEDWPFLDPDITPDSQRQRLALQDSSLACEYGYLGLVLQKSRYLRGESGWMPLVALARWTRNELSHYRTVTFADYEALVREIGRAKRLGLMLPNEAATQQNK